MTVVGTFEGIWRFGGVLESNAFGVISTLVAAEGLGILTAVPGAQGDDFVIYDAGPGKLQMQSQQLNLWLVGSPDPSRDNVAVLAEPPPSTVQYTGTLGSTVRFSSADKVISVGVPLVWSDPDPDPDLDQFSSTMVVPSLFDIRNAGQAPGADLTNVILDGADFSGVNLAGATFTNASLQRVNFIGATLAGADLADQDLRVCTLGNTNLSGANLQGATLGVVDAKTDLSGADLRGAHLADATLAGVNLSRAKLSGASIDGLDLRGANLAGTDFSGLDVRNVKFDASPAFSTDPANLTKFTGATLPFSIIGLRWSYLDLVEADILGLPVDAQGHLVLTGLQAVAADLSGWLFSNANLRSSGASVANFTGACLVGANFSGADCTRANFTQATLGGGPGQGAAVMSRATLFNASFADAQLSGVSFSGAYLYGASASLSGATMAGVDFANAYLAELDLSNVRDGDMAGAIFDGACCVNCNFKGTTVWPDATTGRGGSFVSACLQGADFSDAMLGGANLVNAGCAPPCPTPGTCKFPVTLTIAGRPVTIQLTIDNAGTVLPASATTHAAVCPDSSFGPCAGTHLYPPNAPKSWPVMTRETG